MPIDRSAYNALVDDDGSNTVGTQFDKNIIKTVLLDPIDAALATSGTVAPSVCEGRLTLTTAVPVTTADVVGATNIFFTPFKGNRISLYSGSAWVSFTFTEKILALGTLTNDLVYDVFAYSNAGVVTLELLPWTSKTARATALVLQDGILVKTGALTRRYLGTFQTTSTTTTEDSFAKRLLWNFYNRTPRALRVIEATDTWTYTTATWRQANAAGGNQLSVVVGIAGPSLRVDVVGIASNTVPPVTLSVGIGEDSTTVPAVASLIGSGQAQVASRTLAVSAGLATHPAIGGHVYTWLERSDPSGVTTWYGDAGTNYFQTGIHGVLEG